MNETEFLKMIIEQIVDKKDKIEVVSEEDDRGTKVSLTVDPSDMGKVIGSKGKTATAIRTIMHSFGGQNNKNIGVFIVEPEER